ncbi:MAG: hypothetical protein WA927_10030, partial [Rhodococcus sp. (in: high G+C Gram-positive bacteria)]
QNDSLITNLMVHRSELHHPMGHYPKSGFCWRTRRRQRGALTLARRPTHFVFSGPLGTTDKTTIGRILAANGGQ